MDNWLTKQGKIYDRPTIVCSTGEVNMEKLFWVDFQINNGDTGKLTILLCLCYLLLVGR